MAHKVLAQVWAKKAKEQSGNEYIIYQFRESDDGWAHASAAHYNNVKHLFPIMEKVE